MKKLLVYSNLGLGDHIACCGMVRHWAKFCNVTLLCKPHNRISVAALYWDLPITIVEVENDNVAKVFVDSWDDNKRLIGCANQLWNNGGDIPFDVTFYAHAGLPHKFRWSKFKYEQNDNPVPSTPYIFLHEDASRGFIIDRSYCKLDIIEPDKTTYPRITDWCNLISCATEVHVINSSFLLLVDQIETIGKLFWHKYARDEGKVCNPTVKKNWVIL